MRLHSLQPRRAFTIMELLVVIAIMAVVAGLIVGLAGATGDSKKISRAQVELASLVTMIEAYKTKVGVYPPDHPSTNWNWGRTTLLYELAGATRKGAAPFVYETPFGSIDSDTLANTFAVGGIINAKNDLSIDPDADNPDKSRMHPILKSIKSDQVGSVAPNSLSLVIPFEGKLGEKPTPWRYRLGNPTNAHNAETFDLWVEIKVRKGTRIIGNWKD